MCWERGEDRLGWEQIDHRQEGGEANDDRAQQDARRMVFHRHRCGFHRLRGYVGHGDLSLETKGWMRRPGLRGDTGSQARRIRQRAYFWWALRSLHVVVVGVLAAVANIENDGLFSEVLPPVRGAGHFRPDIASLVRDRHFAI